MLVHADLHYGNVLVGQRESWLAIDPKPVAGDPEHAVPELLWTRVDELEDAAAIRRLLAVLASSGELDGDKARGWAIVRGVDYWLWGLENGLTEDPKRCQRILAAHLMQPAATWPAKLPAAGWADRVGAMLLRDHAKRVCHYKA